jgi:Tol biopolymer transport system component
MKKAILLCWLVATTALADQALLDRALKGPLQSVNEIVFATRDFGKDGHWYANFAYYCPDPQRKAYASGGQLCALDIRTGKVRVLVDDTQGGIRDPQVHYDAKKIIFSWRKAGAEHFNLWEIDVDGKNLRRITDAPFDDIEPTYLPDGGIVFVSTRCKRWVNCWLTQVAVLYRCDADGKNVRILSSNIEHDNTPAVMNDGLIM